MRSVRDLIETFREYNEISEAGLIARRAFVNNSFDGVLTMMGVIMGSLVVGVEDPKVVIVTGISTATAIGISGGWGAYLAESAEREHAIEELQGVTLTDLRNSKIGKASRLGVKIVAPPIDSSVSRMKSSYVNTDGLATSPSNTCNWASGLEVPKPTLPDADTSILLVGASGRILNGSCEPFVTSRIKKFVSFPARSQVWGVNPLDPSCSRRRVGVSPSFTCSSTTGDPTPTPTSP